MTYYNINGSTLLTMYDINGTIINIEPSYSNDYEEVIYNAKNEWMKDAKTDDTITPIIIHTDQHGGLTTNNTLFPYLGKIVPFEDISGCIGLGDVGNSYSATGYSDMQTCLNDIPKNRQINIWGNHDTWGGSGVNNTVSNEELSVLNTYFDNSQYNKNHKYNNYGVEYMIDEKRKIKYVVISGWEYNADFGGHSHYVMSSDTIDYIIQMLSTNDEYDIVILSHIQPFSTMKTSDWVAPPVEDCSSSNQDGGGGIDVGVDVIVNRAETSIDQMLIDRKNKVSGTVKDSYQNEHSYDFTNCTSDLICCLAGHEHCDKYMWQNNNIPVYIFDAYRYDKNPFYFVNIDRTKKRLNIWKIDTTPTVYNYQIPFEKVTT